MVAPRTVARAARVRDRVAAQCTFWHNVLFAAAIRVPQKLNQLSPLIGKIILYSKAQQVNGSSKNLVTVAQTISNIFT